MTFNFVLLFSVICKFPVSRIS